ncbi:lytic transglycosylase domain-containing protein [Donghicola sp. C2-DW-16]|uniref:Lytic transglycosylase domain-containing protein n=1 Tax=Donghicola mangrovi TaxID=2729614 RepID=A0ABX2PAX5_9RHOB|nr:transglycosylase SLT domain-containing protein [Donghicola mangrovi]NVO26315.1 lytic transglycosylase domain-containing protein [Donghicola mangrovi]
MARSIVLTALLAVFGAMPVWAARVPSCEAQALQAEKAAGIPTYLLAAITRTETGHTRRGRGFGAWPWTLNIKGKGYYYESREEAIAAFRDAIAQGLTSIDVGCMQLNYRWHGQAFSSIEDMFDPVSNAAYAAQFLTSLKDRHGSWEEAVKRYHSSTDALGTKYLARVEKSYEAFTKEGLPAAEIMVASAAPPESAVPRVLVRSGDLLGYVGKMQLPKGNLPTMPQSGHKAIPPKAYDFSAPASGVEDAATRLASLKAAFGVAN